ncbi:hypothetical protein [Pseudonocardia alni]|uniref:hypothetical protein n=1 Tax=Pseudonocardia alni TaxID=33907 RepID=UPI00332CBA51
MSYETPRSSDGTRLCAWCGGPVRQSGVGRAKEYCKQGCREMAYRARREQRRIAEAVAAATAPLVSSTDDRPVSSTDDRVPHPKTSVDETVSVQVTPAIPAPAVEPDPPAAEPVVRPALAPLPQFKGRRRVGMTASAIPLPEPAAGEGPDWDERLAYWEKRTASADGAAPDVDPRGWLRAFDTDERQEQGSLFEDQAQAHPDGQGSQPTHGA